MSGDMESIQLYNDEVNKHVTDMKKKRDKIQGEIVELEGNKVIFQKELNILQEKIKQTGDLLDKKYAIRKEYDVIILDSNEEMKKLLHSSQMLLNNLQKKVNRR